MQNEPDIKAKVLAKIGRGDVHKRSHAYFVMQVVVVAVLLACALALSVFVLSFAIFSVHESGEQFLLGFGQRGVLTFFALFPWASAVADIALFVLVEWLIRRFKFGYRIPILRALLGILVFAAIGGIMVNLTPLHATLLRMAEQNELPVLGEWYESIHASHSDYGVFRGTINSIQEGRFVISHDDNDHDADDGTWTVIPPAGFDMATVATGERIYVAGTPVQPGIIQAYGIQQLSGDM